METHLREAASENKKMRIEEGKGSHVIQFWKTLKETIHSHDLAYGKAIPENMVQHNGILRSSWESQSVLNNPHEGKDHIMYKGKQRAIWSEQCREILRSDELLKSGLTMEMNLENEKKGYIAVLQILPLPD